MPDKSTVIPYNSVRTMPLVLVVDDNQDNLSFACGSLDLLDCQHLVANNGKQALDLAVDRLPDLILMDIVMPEIDGITATQVLKSNLITNHIPIIAVTGLAYAHHRELIMNAGCDGYLCKPYLIEDLESKLNSFLRA